MELFFHFHHAFLKKFLGGGYLKKKKKNLRTVLSALPAAFDVAIHTVFSFCLWITSSNDGGKRAGYRNSSFLNLDRITKVP